MAVNYSELSGGYNSYTRMFVEDSVNFAISWNYCIQWLSVISIELVTAAITIEYWISRERVDPDAWVAIFFVVIVVVNFIGSKAYGEFEFIIGLCKVCLLVGFIIMGIVVNVGVVQNMIILVVDTGTTPVQLQMGSKDSVVCLSLLVSHLVKLNSLLYQLLNNLIQDVLSQLPVN